MQMTDDERRAALYALRERVRDPDVAAAARREADALAARLGPFDPEAFLAHIRSHPVFSKLHLSSDDADDPYRDEEDAPTPAYVSYLERELSLLRYERDRLNTQIAPHTDETQAQAQALEEGRRAIAIVELALRWAESGLLSEGIIPTELVEALDIERAWRERRWRRDDEPG